MIPMETDPDVLAVTQFMQASVSADKLIGVSSAIAQLAPALWGHFDRSEVRALTLSITPVCEPQILPSSM